MKKKRVVIAMSGGVDSSVAAALLLEKGYDCIGITLKIWDEAEQPCFSQWAKSCCSYESARDARAVCDRLGIPHYTLNFRELFTSTVVEDFYSEYLKGRTPNPCIKCNQIIKFDLLLKKIKQMDADFLATGHYARIVHNDTERRCMLLKGLDHAKDQSYVLYMLNQDQLSRIILPMGELSKKETRKIAKNLSLPTAEKAESQEICFIPDNNYGKFIAEKFPSAFSPGAIKDSSGKIIGKHKGIIFYTIGQRKGLGALAPNPFYVTKIDTSTNTIYAGPVEELYKKKFIVSSVSMVCGAALDKPLEALVKIRYTFKEAPAKIHPNGKDAVVEFYEPQKSITPGQAAVFYEGEEVLGGGTIENA
ncbi:MAG: tRNA 2-thiouridine(34) synthase MnmA [Firmicutes bacterium]|nr:tRNA 2-thiouridine(34) synthase MnmA [Bacillota bacterium]